MKFPLSHRPFPDVTLSGDECFQHERRLETLVNDTLDEFDRFVTRDRRFMDQKAWKAVKTREDVTVYKQQSRRDASPKSTWRMPKLVAVGTIAGSLDDIMYGIVTHDAQAITVKTSYVNDELVDSAVLHKIHGATAQDPFRFVGLKWLAMAHPQVVNTFVKPRDFVFIESTGILTRPDGDRIGYHAIHSIDHPQCPELTELSIVRARLSNCYLYRQFQPGLVEVYMTTYSDPGGNPPETIAIASAASTLIGVWKAAWCAQNKKLWWLLSNAAARRRYRETVAVATGANSRRCCAMCFKQFRSTRPLNSCQLCTAWVCTRCRVRRKLSASNDALDLIQRDVEVCKRCIVRVSIEDSMRIAREEYVGEPEPVEWSKRERKMLLSPEDAALHDQDDGTLIANPGGKDRRASSSGKSWEDTEVEDNEAEDADEEAAETADDWARQTRPLPLAAYVPVVQPAEEPSGLLLQMQSLCLAAEETYLLASRTFVKPTGQDHTK